MAPSGEWALIRLSLSNHLQVQEDSAMLLDLQVGLEPHSPNEALDSVSVVLLSQAA